MDGVTPPLRLPDRHGTCPTCGAEAGIIENLCATARAEGAAEATERAAQKARDVAEHWLKSWGVNTSEEMVARGIEAAIRAGGQDAK